MKLLLTSTGLGQKRIATAFVSLFEKPVEEIIVLFITTASRTKEELQYVQEAKRELLDLKLKEENIHLCTHLDTLTEKQVLDADCIYVCGGNTFYLLDHVKKNGFDKTIKKWVRRKTPEPVYVGVSAGSIIAGQDISIAASEDTNDVGLKEFTGFCFIKEVISPHYTEKEKQFVETYRKKGFSVIPLRDEEALLISGKERRIITQY